MERVAIPPWWHGETMRQLRQIADGKAFVLHRHIQTERVTEETKIFGGASSTSSHNSAKPRRCDVGSGKSVGAPWLGCVDPWVAPWGPRSWYTGTVL